MLDTRGPATHSTERLAWRAEIGVASLVALAVVLIVLWEPIVFFRSRTLGPWDWLAQSSPLTRVEPDTPIENPAMGDPVRQFIPWSLFARDELAHGRAPLWSTLNGTGVPILANYQSAVFSPFNLPYYLLPLKPAVLLSAASKLFVAAVGMFLLLRSLSRSRPAAALGAMAYALSGFHMLCLLHPHVGVLALLPLGLLAVDRAARAFAGDPTRLPLSALAGLSIALGLIVLAGHPESLLFCVYFVAAFSAYHVGRRAWLGRRDGVQLRRAARLGVALAFAGVLGGALGAIQLVPFAEYLGGSASLAMGGRDVEPLSPSYVMLQLFPNIAGTMLGGQWISRGLVPGYHECNAFYVGGTITLLALGATLFLRGAPDMQFFLALGLGVFLYAFDAPVLSTVLGPLFGSHYVPAPRASALWVISACVLSAFTLDHLLAARVRGRALAIVGAGVLAVIACRVGVERFWRGLAERDASRFGELEPFLRENVNAMTVALAVGLAALCALALSARAAVRLASVAALLAVIAAHNVIGFGGYVPTVEDRFVLPRTPAIEGLTQALDGERAVLLSTGAIQTNANLFHDLALITSYDALEIRELDELRGELFGYSGYFALALQASRLGFDLFGVRYLATRGEWVPVDTERSRRGMPEVEARWYISGELGLGSKLRPFELNQDQPRVRQGFIASRDGLDGLVVHFVDEVPTHSAVVTLELFDAAARESLGLLRTKLGDLRPVPSGRLECVLPCAAQRGSKDQRFELEVRLEEPLGIAPVRLFRGRAGEAKERSEEGEKEPGNWWIEAEGEPLERGRFVLDVSYGRGDFTRVGEHGDFVLHRYEPGRGRAWIVTQAIGVNAESTSREHVLEQRARVLERVLGGDFDARSAVVIEGASSTEEVQGSFRLETVSETTQASRYRAHCDVPAFLVLAQPCFPGWKARVDGRATPLLRANYAFQAVALPEGESEVELAYEPASFRMGWMTSLAACLALLAGWLVVRTSR